LPHNNRVGDLDAFALGYAARSLGITLEEAERQLCREGGLLAVSGGYNDIRDIETQAGQGNPRARLSLDFLVHEACRWIGAFLVQLQGLDALVFTAGIGENSVALRSAIGKQLEPLGLRLDPARNAEVRGREGRITRDDSPIAAWVIPANEELVVAREVQRHLETTP
jgi:acetate kinase